jgi:hypothetical protein
MAHNYLGVQSSDDRLHEDFFLKKILQYQENETKTGVCVCVCVGGFATSGPTKFKFAH